MVQPEGFIDHLNPHYVCRLHKTLYGLKQAPRAWFDRLKVTLQHWGFHNSVSVPSLFYNKKTGHVLFLLVYVDDILITRADSTVVHHLIQDLNATFAFKSLGLVRYSLGFEVTHTSSALHLYQAKYASDLLVRTNMHQANTSPTPMSLTNKLSLHESSHFAHPSLYRSVIGALQYLTHTRLDLSFAFNKLSQFLQAPTVNHWSACKRILRCIVGTLVSPLLILKC